MPSMTRATLQWLGSFLSAASWQCNRSSLNSAPTQSAANTGRSIPCVMTSINGAPLGAMRGENRENVHPGLSRVKIGYAKHLKNFESSRPSALNFRSFSQSVKQFFLTVGQNNFGIKIPSLILPDWMWFFGYYRHWECPWWDDFPIGILIGIPQEFRKNSTVACF